MGRTIHYRVTNPPMLMGVGGIPDQPHGEWVERAGKLARGVLTELDFPHRMGAVDRRKDPEAAYPGLVYGLSIDLLGPGKGCEELCFGWKQAEQGQQAWTGQHYCKTEFARSRSRTHRAVMAVLQAWDSANLLEWVRDEAKQYRGGSPAPETGPEETVQLSMDLGPPEPVREPAKRPPEGAVAVREPAVRPPEEAVAVREPAKRPDQDERNAFILAPERIRKELRANVGRSASKGPPVVKIFCPAGSATWLLHGLEADGDTAFGLCDLGMGFPELGYVSIGELQELRVNVQIQVNGRPLTMPIRLERDLYFRPEHTLEVYARAAMAADGITESPERLAEAAARLPQPRHKRRAAQEKGGGNLTR